MTNDKREDKSEAARRKARGRLGKDRRAENRPDVSHRGS